MFNKQIKYWVRKRENLEKNLCNAKANEIPNWKHIETNSKALIWKAYAWNFDRVCVYAARDVARGEQGGTAPQKISVERHF